MKKTTIILTWLWLGVLCVSTASVWGIVWVTDMFFFEPCEYQWWILLSVLYTVHILFLSIGATTMFFNCLEKVRNNKWLCFMSFFLVPFLMMIVEITSRVKDWDDALFVSIGLVPFALCLSTAYVLFLCWNSKNHSKSQTE